MDNPDLANLATKDPAGMSEARYAVHRQATYITLWFRYLEYSYLVGNLTNESLRQTLVGDLFTNRTYRNRWRFVEAYWQKEAVTDRERAFIRIVNDACAAAEE